MSGPRLKNRDGLEEVARIGGWRAERKRSLRGKWGTREMGVYQLSTYQKERIARTRTEMRRDGRRSLPGLADDHIDGRRDMFSDRGARPLPILTVALTRSRLRRDSRPVETLSTPEHSYMKVQDESS